MSVSLPHFDVPFRYKGAAPVVNEQDSIGDVAVCVYAVLVTPPGTRDEMPDFGLDDLTFSQEPIPAQVIVAQVTQWEPRAGLLVDSAPDVLDATIVNANIQVEVIS